MRKLFLGALLGACATISLAAPVPKEQLMVPPPDSRHFTMTSSAGKVADAWAWTLPDGRHAYRFSRNLRGWITETDEVVTVGADKRPTRIVVRGFTDSGDAAEDYWVDDKGIAHWKTSVDEGSAPFGDAMYNVYGGVGIADEDLVALLAAGPDGLDLLPGGHATLELGKPTTFDTAKGPLTLHLATVTGYGYSPSQYWVYPDGRFFGRGGIVTLVPAGYESLGPKLKEIQDASEADMLREVAHRFLIPANRTPTLIDNVLMFDSVGGRYLPAQAVLIADGKISAMGAAGSISAPAGATVIDGRGKTLLPGLWDSHLHVGGYDWGLAQNLATGITNYRSPGSTIEDSLSLLKRRASGDLLAPDGKISVIVDRKDPLSAQGSIPVSNLEETLAAVHRIKDSGLWGVKFYGTMKPEWIAPAVAEAHKLGLHVHGHIPAGMRPLDAVRAGYDEITHINFAFMQAMPQDIVDKTNTAARLEGPARYGKDVDLDSPEMKAYVAELAKRKTIVDPTMTVWEPLMTSDGSEIPAAYAPFAPVSPPGVARIMKISGYPLFGGLTRDDFRKSYAKMVEFVGRLHEAGVPVVAGTDGSGMELVRELEIYEDAGMSNAEAIQSATILPARITGMDSTVGSIAPGKTASLILVEGDVSKDLGNLRHVVTVFSDGYRLSGDELRAATGLTGMPK